jgi:urea transport system permease protein
MGPVIGALLVTYMQSWLSAQFESMWELLMGAFFLLVIIFQPDGIMGLPSRFRRRPRPAKTANGLQAPKHELEA